MIKCLIIQGLYCYQVHETVKIFDIMIWPRFSEYNGITVKIKIPAQDCIILLTFIVGDY